MPCAAAAATDADGGVLITTRLLRANTGVAGFKLVFAGDLPRSVY